MSPRDPTQLLPRMVARLGMSTFNGASRFDFIDTLPELRPVERGGAAEAQAQAAELVRLVREHAARHQPAPTSFPALAMRVMDRTQDRRAGVDQIVSLVAQDAAVSSSVLRATNSSLYRRSGPAVINVKTAVAQIGLDEVRRIAAAVAARSLYDLELVSEFQLFAGRWSDLFHRSMTVAFSAGWLAAQNASGAPERAFLGGMFHDIGKTLALRSLSALVMGGQVAAAPSDAAVSALLEEVHVDIGVAMHLAWSLPDDLTAICRHHHAREFPEGVPVDLHVVRICSALADLQLSATAAPDAADTVRDCIRRLDLSFKQYRLLTARITAFSEQVASMFGLDSAPGETPAAAGS